MRRNKMITDLLDEFCMKQFGHNNWYQISNISEQIDEEEEDYIAIVFLKKDCYD
tara:strand:- start:30 stop:191 length:162 start_codon:yes stop_codon:yes gene_type:complete